MLFYERARRAGHFMRAKCTVDRLSMDRGSSRSNFRHFVSTGENLGRLAMALRSLVFVMAELMRFVCPNGLPIGSTGMKHD